MNPGPTGPVGDRIDDLETSVHVIPTDVPEADGTLAWDATTLVTVRVGAGDSVGTGWTFAPRATARVVVDTLAPLVRGRGVDDIAAIHREACHALRNQGRCGIATCALSAVDIALWDLRARCYGVALCTLLGQVHTRVPVYGSGGFTTYDADRLARQLSGWVDGLGFDAVKIKIGESWGTRVDRDLERIAQARATIGDEVRLLVDANGAYGVAQAIRVMERAVDADVVWFEEPVSSDDLEGLAEVRRGVDAVVAAGEYGWDEWTLRRLCSSGAVDCLQVDATRCGGVTGWIRAAAVAEAYGLQVSAHCAPQLHAHLAAATSNLRHVEYFHDHVRIADQCLDGVLDPTGGSLTPDTARTGHGLTLRDTAAARFAVDRPAVAVGSRPKNSVRNGFAGTEPG